MKRFPVVVAALVALLAGAPAAAGEGFRLVYSSGLGGEIDPCG